MKKNSSVWFGIGNIMALVATLIVNSLSALLPLNGRTPGELSDLYPNLFVPEGLTFSIWGILYLLMLVYSVTQLTLSFQETVHPVIGRISFWFILSCFFNSAWIFAWHYELMWLSVLCMLLLLGSLILLYLRLGIGQPGSSNAVRGLVHICFSAYLGWISVATIANITAALVKAVWSGWGLMPQTWAVILILCATVLGLCFIFLRGDIFAALVIEWALLGIFLKRSLDMPPLHDLLGITLASMVVLILAIVLQTARRRIYLPLRAART